jgi:DNA-binding HxlR family transcriptional regulator
MDLLSRKYAIPVICVVNAVGPVRYGDIEDMFGEVSSSTLSTRLEDLVEAGYLSREQYAEIPPRVEYDLTTSGEDLAQRLEPLVEWAKQQDDFPQ